LKKTKRILLFYDNKIQDEKKKLAEEEKAREQAVANAKLDIANNTLGLINEIAGKGSKIGKAIAVSQATISGIQGVQNAFSTAQDSPITKAFPAYPFIQAGLAGAFSALQIKKILSTSTTSAGSASNLGSGGGTPSAPSAPSFNIVQGSASNQIATSLQNRTPIQAFVVSSNVTTAQSLDRNIVQSARL
jgi:hypothetical protein